MLRSRRVIECSPRVRHELALIAVGCLAVADIHCR
ncbi:Ms4533A family Cys-rich leader peptide [Nocardia seriolae]